jgi:hypothetical protein
METPGAVQIDVYYFPGWSVAVDGQPATFRPSAPTGAILVDLPAGEHRIDARFDAYAVGTPSRALGAAISGAVLLAVIALLAWPARGAKGLGALWHPASDRSDRSDRSDSSDRLYQ